jgi:hypothetical protein
MLLDSHGSRFAPKPNLEYSAGLELKEGDVWTSASEHTRIGQFQTAIEPRNLKFSFLPEGLAGDFEARLFVVEKKKNVDASDDAEMTDVDATSSTGDGAELKVFSEPFAVKFLGAL